MKTRRHARPRKVVLKCRSCGWKWIPDPTKWRNDRNRNTSRGLKCPRCNVINMVAKDVVRRILRTIVR